jgi:hypothetical protein
MKDAEGSGDAGADEGNDLGHEGMLGWYFVNRIRLGERSVTLTSPLRGGKNKRASPVSSIPFS